MKSIRFKYENLNKAYKRLNEAVSLFDGANDIIRDSIIQRFEFTYELSHKILRSYMEYSGVVLDTTFPRAIFKEAFVNKLIDNDEIWIKLLEDRNTTSHIYKEEVAKEIADRIVKIYIFEFEKLVKRLGELI